MISCGNRLWISCMADPRSRPSSRAVTAAMLRRFSRRTSYVTSSISICAMLDSQVCSILSHRGRRWIHDLRTRAGHGDSPASEGTAAGQGARGSRHACRFAGDGSSKRAGPELQSIVVQGRRDHFGVSRVSGQVALEFAERPVPPDQHATNITCSISPNTAHTAMSVELQHRIAGALHGIVLVKRFKVLHDVRKSRLRFSTTTSMVTVFACETLSPERSGESRFQLRWD